MSPTHFGELIGLTHLSAPADQSLLEIELLPQLCNRQGMVHGGVLLTLMDVAGLWAGVPAGTQPRAATVSLNGQFLNAARREEGLRLQAHGQVVRRSRTLYFATVSVFASNGGPQIASGQGVYHILPASTAPASIGTADAPAQ
jgi:uncharacterized protein (TIGR00369 family)